MNVIVEPSALDEVTDALEWYLVEAGVDRASAFELEFDSKIRLLRDHPQMGTPVLNGTRSMPFKTYPYTIHYKVDGDILRIFAVAHQKRRPGYWAKR